MARFYDILVSKSGAKVLEITSFPNGKSDPGALNVQLDIQVAPFATPAGNSTITIEGVPLNLLQQAQIFTTLDITVKAGMQAGLPLAKPSQAGTIVSGQIYQSFGNWVGTDMSLNFVVAPGGFTFTNPGNFVFNWQKGQDISEAIRATLAAAYPTGAGPQITIGTYTTNSTVAGQYHTLAQFAAFIKSITKSPTSDGITIAPLTNGVIAVYDANGRTKPIQIDFLDLVGQPKWIDVATMQFVTVMRSGIELGNAVLMPKGLPYAPGAVTTNAGTNPYGQLKYSTAFQGQFLVTSVRHTGNFRDADGESWTTVFEAVPLNV